MRRFSIIAWLAFTTMWLTACGGSSSDIICESGSTASQCTPTTTSTVATITVGASTATIASDGSTSSTLTAVAKDANNAVVSGAKIAFTASAGDITVTQATTDATGSAIATLTAGSAAAGTAITVKATDGSISGTATVTVASIQETVTLVTSVPSIPSDGSSSATITALVRNAQNQLVPNVAVSFSASSGGLAVANNGTTGDGTSGTVFGAATATLSSAGDPSNRTITVTATVNGATATIPVQVTGTSLTVTGPASLVSGSTATYTVSLTEAGGATGIANQVVKLTSASGNTLSAASVTTQANGQQTFTVTAAKGGADTITATALDLSATQALTVSTQSFAFIAPTTADYPVNLGATGTLTVSWTSAGAPQTGSTVTFSSTRGTLSAQTATIGNDGTATITITSNAAGPAVITATGSGVTAQASIEFIATHPTQIAVQASPTTIPTQGQSTITATLRDANDNLVEGQVVDFSITQDATGGSLSVASATTNVQGQASTVYTASTTTSATNGVIISADVPTATAVAPETASLTVGGQSVFLSLGTGNTIAPLNSTQYEMPYTVQAIDAAGNGVNNVTVTFKVTSVAYFKGYFNFPTGATMWKQNFTTLPSDPDVSPDGGCLSEDLAGNGILVPSEDYNGNGKLDPGLVASTDVGSAITANGGTAAVNIIYPKDHANWVEVTLSATATVSGNQSSAKTTFVLPGLAGDYDVPTVSPPGEISPYGDNGGSVGTCQNPN